MTTIPALITQTHLEERIGVARLRQLTDLVGMGKAPPAAVASIIQVGSRKAVNLLAPGFTAQEAVAILQGDEWYQTQIAWIAIGLAAEGRSEFMDPNGTKFLYDAPFNRALKELEQLGRKRERSASEETVGKNRLVSPRVSRFRNRPRQFTFVDSKDRRGSGGF